MKRFVFGTLLSLTFVLLFTTGVMAAAQIEIIPTQTTVAQDKDFQIDVYVKDVDDLYGFSFNMVFDPAAVKVVSGDEVLDSGDDAVIPGNLGSSFQVAHNKYDNTSGTIRFAEVLMAKDQGTTVTSETLAASVKFRAINKEGLHLKPAAGDGKIHELGIADPQNNFLIQLSNSNAEAILYETPADLNVTVEDTRCFIATAAYGSYLDPHVMGLRQFRDKHLLTSALGRSFVEFYYRNSPPLAAYITQHQVLKTTARMLLTPIVFAVLYPTKTLTVMAAACLFLVLALRQKRQAMRTE
ncbi:MAG: cohesin domain-containing protein [Syntrophomonadaceae bacterium]|nr:cohesin domain-containing protein [Syntrophomonadaceae bacterium]